MTKSLDLQKCAIDDLFCPVCRAIMLQILLNASSASLPKFPPFSTMNGMKLLLSWLRYCCLYRAFLRIALFVVMLLGVLDASLQYETAAGCTTLKSMTAFTPSLSAVRSDVPISAISALHGSLPCWISGICSAGVVGICHILEPSLNKIMASMPKVANSAC